MQKTYFDIPVDFPTGHVKFPEQSSWNGPLAVELVQLGPVELDQFDWTFQLDLPNVQNSSDEWSSSTGPTESSSTGPNWNF